MAKDAKPKTGTGSSKPQRSDADSWVLLLIGVVLVAFMAYLYQEYTLLEAAQRDYEGVSDEDNYARQAAAQRYETRNPKINNFDLDIPRVTVEELDTNRTLRTGHHAFVLTGAMQGRWAAENWTLSLLANKIPFEWVDFYPENMKDVEKKPWLLHLDKAVPKFKQRSGKAKYMQMRISLRGWKRLRKDFQPMPSSKGTFWSDDTWIRHCMKTEDGRPDEEAISNFYTTNQWKFLLIGESGTSMFFHKDHTAASSWQAMLKGRKKWTLCPNTEARFLTTGMDTFNPDYKRYPGFAQAKCGQTVVHPGELVYYPAYWWHHIMNLDTPSIAYTGALVGTEAEYDSQAALGGSETKAHLSFYDDLRQKCSKCWTKGKKDRHCDDISLTWPGAAPPPLRRVCDKFLPKCYELWEEHSRLIGMTAAGEYDESDEDDEMKDVGSFA